MRLFATSISMATVLSLLSAASAQACIPLPPTYWPNVRFEGGPAMMIGRVVSVTRASAPVRTEYFEIWNETALITPIETVQGTPQPEYSVTAVGDYRELKSGLMFCGDQMSLTPGDVVFGYEKGGRLQVVEPHTLPEDFRIRLEARQ